MNALLAVAHAYFDAWNRHDADAIVAGFAEGGTYEDPTSGRISGAAIGAYASGLWEAFPDLSFEIVSAAEAGPGMVAAQWVMNGVNTGPFMGLPPSGRSVSLAGADFIEIADGRITSVRGYFDTRILPEQLGLQVIVQPHEIGPYAFGYAVAVHSGKDTCPGAFSITAIHNDKQQTEEIAGLSRDTARDMLGMEGFIGVTMTRIGGMGVTISAWEKPENVQQMMRGGAHGQAMQRFWAELGQAGFTSIWSLHTLNPFWVRCTGCNKMVDYEKHSGVCPCGQTLPERPPYF